MQLNQELREKALRLLGSEDLLCRFLDVTERSGLVGEERNAMAVMVTGVSRLLDLPLNLLVKGSSSSGKNYTVDRSLRTLPGDAVRTLTSSSEHAWNYAENYFQHSVVYVKERNAASGAVYPARLLISEGKLERIVSVRQGNRWVQQKFVAKGPIACISTTTKNQLEIDEETRHISIWTDESPQQTRRIVSASASGLALVAESELDLWRTAHRLIEERSKATIVLPAWFDQLASKVYVGDLRVRRYFRAFRTICETIALVRSFLPERDLRLQKTGKIDVDFTDYAITARIFEPIFARSLSSGDEQANQTRAMVKKILARTRGKGVAAPEFAKEAEVPLDRAYAELREAAKQGTIVRANKPESANRKLYRPSSLPRFLPHPKQVFRTINEVGDSFAYIDPLNGEWVRGSR
jgi:hypothetical protein